MTKYYQCRLEQETKDGLITEVAWIEEKGASIGALVELKGQDGLWRVKTVCLSSTMSQVDLSNVVSINKRQRAFSDI